MADDSSDKMRTTPPYWWPDTQGIMQLFLAAAIVGMVWYILMQLLSGDALKIDPSVRDLIVFIFGIVFGNFKDVYGFTYGSSAESKNKGEVINRSLDTKDKIIADGATTTAAALAAVAPLAATPSPGTASIDDLGRTSLKNGDLAFFLALPDEDAKRKFLAMDVGARAAARVAAAAKP